MFFSPQTLPPFCMLPAAPFMSDIWRTVSEVMSSPCWGVTQNNHFAMLHYLNFSPEACIQTTSPIVENWRHLWQAVELWSKFL